MINSARSAQPDRVEHRMERTYEVSFDLDGFLSTGVVTDYTAAPSRTFSVADTDDVERRTW